MNISVDRQRIIISWLTVLGSLIVPCEAQYIVLQGLNMNILNLCLPILKIQRRGGWTSDLAFGSQNALAMMSAIFNILVPRPTSAIGSVNYHSKV